MFSRCMCCKNEVAFGALGILRQHCVVSRMAFRTKSRSGGWLTLVLLVLWLASPAALEHAHNQTSDNSSITIEAYSVDDSGSSCVFMSGIGTSILRGIADSPDDAYVLEEAVDNPDAGAVKELVTYHQRGVNVFLTVLWGVVIFFSIFMIAAIIQVLYILCTGTFEYFVVKYNTCAYIFCVIIVAILLIAMIVLLVFLIGCRGALAYSTAEKAVGLDQRRHSSSAVVATTHHAGPSPSVVRTVSKTAVVAPPTTVLVQPPTVVTPPPTVVTPPPTVVTPPPAVVAPPPTILTQPATVLTAPPTVAVQAPPVPLVVQAPPPAPTVAASPIGTGPAENQQAATAHMTINFYGSPAGGTFGIPMAGYPAGYLTAAGQPYYYAAAPRCVRRRYTSCHTGGSTAGRVRNSCTCRSRSSHHADGLIRGACQSGG
ncbi:hypothetical protein MTO96_011622 [Rhipicephalus appendiculatus]